MDFKHKYELLTIPYIDDGLLPDQAPYFIHLTTKGFNLESVGGFFRSNQIDVFDGSPTAAKNDMIDQLIDLDKDIKNNKPYDLEKMKHLAVKTTLYENFFAEELKSSMQETPNSGNSELMNQGPSGKSTFFDVMHYSKALLERHLDVDRLGSLRQTTMNALSKPYMKK